MNKILLYSKNKKNIKKIMGIKNPEGFNIKIEETFDNLQTPPENIYIIILDITSKNEGNDIHIKNIIEIADEHNILFIFFLFCEYKSILFMFFLN